MRVLPNAHCSLWVKDSPKINEDPDEVVCQFIDKYITTHIPEPMHANEIDIETYEAAPKTCIQIIVDKTIPAGLGSQNHHLLELLLRDLQIVKTKMKC